MQDAVQQTGASPRSSCPVAAVHPISGGTAPTTAPTQVLLMLRTLRGVYTPAYSTMLPAPSAAVRGLACTERLSIGPTGARMLPRQ